MAHIIDGKQLSQTIIEDITQKTADYCRNHPPPCLAILCVGDDPASKVYIGSKTKTLEKVGMQHRYYHFDSCEQQHTIINLIHRLNTDPAVHAILLQLPLPAHLDSSVIMQEIHPLKDVDGFTPCSIGNLLLGKPVFIPCTPQGILYALQATGVPIAGQHAVIVGRSAIVGKPLAALLTNADATVTLCHSKTEHLASYTCQADILVAAVGKAGFITADMVKKNSIVIDVGINRITDHSRLSGTRLVGDVDFHAVKEIAGFITPVPGGIGPLTVAMLLCNTLAAAQKQKVTSKN